MINWIKPPKKSEVAKYIEYYWLIEKHPNAKSLDYPKLNPDPSAHLIISPPEQNYHYDMNPGSSVGKGSHWLFPHHRTLKLDHSKPFVYLGVKFHVGALYSLNIFTGLHTQLNSVDEVKLAKLFTKFSEDELQLIEQARNNPDLCCDTLDRLFLSVALNSHEDQHSQITRKALQMLNTEPISALGKQLFCSQRTLERSFKRVTGLTLKQCQSMNKLEAMLEYLNKHHSNDIDWVEIAFQFGFSDQPHLIRYLKKQIGLTPKTYEKERGLTIDVYGGVSSM
ncbi:TPA: helix-turn-helix domain-containing protein [Vibrio cholerae]|uniref:helix-turn-helix domain-containing protein n=1 Tax=Vibrio cholerae TaxID=666 RepID=UPI001582164C|nr:helix-turn-helix domain-containing protein [Vibrio cholerae]EGR2040841.1 helix-turn-helix domain-containing protein [Vibrio cholerae]EGR2064685.1 helix-turn-helix domain-containing protein [Vibrio cholerae]EGR2115877.1 helix-turn-helix domain-containing protein [Vibrio cholerae]EGR2244783.1 helix-turn-helix domain-containing protein [Vibrio cholerae]ELI1752146.1 helix-turn-helix domain-containing protein [Vibrio cholerae]